MRGIVKAGAAVVIGLAGLAAVVLAGLLAFGLYIHHAKSPRFAKASAWNAPASAPAEVIHSGGSPQSREARRTFVGDLLALEEAGEFGELGAMAMDLAPTLDPVSRLAGIRWFEERITWGRAPSLFILSRMHAAAGEMERAAEWYMAGSLCYRIDAECVADATARQAAALLEAELNDVRAVLRDRPKEIARCIAWALDFEEAHREREPAQWIAAHGIASIEKEPAEIASDREVFLSDPERENARAKIRRAFERMQNEAAGQAAREAATPKSGRTS